MRLRRPCKATPAGNHALTRVETLLVAGCVMVVILVFLLPHLARTGAKSSIIRCVSNQKQIALATRLWAEDHRNQFVWEVSTNQGGTLELADSTNIWLQWFAMRREIESPRVLTCPMDSSRPSTRAFSNQTTAPTSYALNFSATLGESNSLLLLERNLVRNRERLGAGWHTIPTNSQLTWDSDPHGNQGNITFADGHGLQGDSAFLRRSFRDSPNATNRLLIP